jgi:hypothetical protein
LEKYICIYPYFILYYIIDIFLKVIAGSENMQPSDKAESMNGVEMKELIEINTESNEWILG